MGPLIATWNKRIEHVDHFTSPHRPLVGIFIEQRYGFSGEWQKPLFYIDLFTIIEASWVWFRFFYGPVLMGSVR